MPLRNRLKDIKGAVKKEFRELLDAKYGQASGSTSSTPAGQPTGVGGKWPRLANFSQILHAGSDALGPLRLVINGLFWCIEMYEDNAKAQEGYETLRTDLEGLFEIMARHFSGNAPPLMTTGINNICVAIEQEMDKISCREQGTAGRRYLKAEKDINEVMASYGRIQKHLERLTLNANLDIWKIVDQQATEARLDKLTPSMSACFDSAEAKQIGRRECTPKTREGVLETLDHWRHDSQQDNLYWLNGMAGTGKTTIASTFCAMLHQSHQLAASFFCTRLLPECRDVKLILPSIAYQLARFSYPFRHALAQSLEQFPDLRTKSLPLQLADLIVNPLIKAKDALPENAVVVIDALDECEGNHAVEELLELFMGCISKLPLKIFVSSRPEPQMRATIDRTNSKLILHDIERSVVREDIETYLQSELGALSLFDSRSELESLVERSGVLFIYAATVVRYIKSGKVKLNCRDRLKAVLMAPSAPSPNMTNNIDALYTAVLDSAFDDSDLEQGEEYRMKLVLNTVVCAQQPLTIAALAGLLRLDHGDRVRAALEPLWSVLHIFGADSIVTTLHASFPEYMLDRTRSLRYHCLSETHHGMLAEFCFIRIKSNECQFNICGLESSYILDKQVRNLDDRIKQAIPLDLMYASRDWVTHLELGGRSTKRSKMLHEFLSDRLLLWMEILNLVTLMDFGTLILEKALKWHNIHNALEEHESLLRDAWRFVSIFAANAVSWSTPHIYVSLLATWPKTRPVSLHYLHRSKGLPKIRGTRRTRRQLSLLGAFSAGSPIMSLALSQDGTRIVSGSRDGSSMRKMRRPQDNEIRVWDARTGQLALGPLDGHGTSVNSVAFSPDGTHIVSGSADGAVRLWDAKTGKLALVLREGCTQPVDSVSFSPDGQRILVGYGDYYAFMPRRNSLDPGYEGSVCICDAQTGQLLLGPLQGHTGAVKSASFSPDGTRIASGSRDGSICIWDAQTGQRLFNLIEVCPVSVNAIAFSPNGAHLVLGLESTLGDYVDDDEATIYVWDMRTEYLIPNSMGLGMVIHSVAFSPDGACIASGSEDGEVCLWDANTGDLLLGPLLGHTGSVASVVFSPDGLRVISGSQDGTIRFWDSYADGQTLHSPEPRTGRIICVTFTSDGTHVVTGSVDHGISFRDSQTGRGAKMPLDLALEDEDLKSVALSLDGRQIVCGCAEARLGYGSASESHNIYTWDAQTGKRLLGPLKGHSGLINSVAFSPDGGRIVSCSGRISRSRSCKDLDRGDLYVWDAHTGQLALTLLEGHPAPVTSAKFSPDGLCIVAGSQDCAIRLWDAKTGASLRTIAKAHDFAVFSVAFSPDSTRIASGSFDKTVRLWDSRTGELVLGPLRHTGWVLSVAFLPDGTRIVSGSGSKGDLSRDVLKDWSLNTVRVWDSQNGQLLLGPLQGHTGVVGTVAFSNDGARIVSGDDDGVVRIWDARPRLDANNSSPHLPNNGWVVDDSGTPLLWMPHDLSGHTLMYRTLLSITPIGSLWVEYNNALVGESWVDCYSPAPPSQ